MNERDQWEAEGPRATVRRVAMAIGAAAEPGDVVALVGPLGAGKTFAAQAVARGAGVPREVRVQSPTFTVVQAYRGRIPVFHADLYRLASVRDVDDTGLFAQAADGLAIVEWADRFPDALPRGVLWITLERTAPLRRRMRLRGDGPAAERLIAAAERVPADARAPRAT